MAGFLPWFRFPFILIVWFRLRFPSFVPFLRFFSFVSFLLFRPICFVGVPPRECAPLSETRILSRGRTHFEGYLRTIVHLSGCFSTCLRDVLRACLSSLGIWALLVGPIRHSWQSNIHCLTERNAISGFPVLQGSAEPIDR